MLTNRRTDSVDGKLPAARQIWMNLPENREKNTLFFNKTLTSNIIKHRN